MGARDPDVGDLDPAATEIVSPVAVVLLVVGAVAVIAGLTSLAPLSVLVAGIAAFCVGAILPLRSFWRRAATARRAALPGSTQP